MSNQLEGLAPCNHEEAFNIFFPAYMAGCYKGHTSLTIKASVTGALVMAISVFQILNEIGLEKLWAAFGQGASRWIPILAIIHSLDSVKSKGIPFFYAYIGCDVVVSSFLVKCKRAVYREY